MKEKIKLSGVPETMLQTIYARAKESGGRGTIHDTKAEEIVGKLENCPVKISAKAGNGGKLFGAVTNKEISEGLKAQYGLDIPKQKLVLDEPIKAYGSYQVKAKLGFEVSGTVYVTVCEEK